MNYYLFGAMVFSCFFPLTNIHAQKEGNIWHFGQGAALDFNSGAAVKIAPSAMSTFEGCASIADANGSLLFYSNGGGRDPVLSGQSSGKIWNRNHEVMYDMGNTEGGGFSAAQSSVIIPKPGVPNHFFLFTMEELEFDAGGSVPGQPLGRGLSYFEIDMTLNAGLGGVIAYTEMIYVPCFEGLCTVRNSNGIDYWIIVHQSNGLGLAVFPVTASGHGAPSFYAAPSGSSTTIKASPDGKWISSRSADGQNIFNFDPATGILSNPVVLDNQSNWGVEFSPNSKRLFLLSTTNELRYFDLISPDINASVTTVSAVPSDGIINGQMQLGPDGEIYFVQVSFAELRVYLSSIVCPNSTPFLNLKKIAYPFNSAGNFFGLPNFDNSLFRNDTDPVLPVNLGADLTLCGPETVVLDAGINNATYQWSTGAETDTLLVATPGIYAVTVTANGCGVGIDTIEIKQVETLTANAGPDVSICARVPFQLNGMGNGTISWMPDTLVSDSGIEMPNFIGDSSTSLILSVMEEGCVVQDTLFITVNDTPVVTAFPADTTFAAGASVQLSGTGVGIASWSPAEGLSCSDCLDPIANPEDTTTYVLTVTTDAGCTGSAQVILRVIPPDCSPEIPNAITPNGDGANDAFQPIGASIESFKLSIYNRWGQAVFQGTTAWDGRSDGQEAPSDVYVYRLNIRLCGVEKPFNGELTLLR